MPPAPPAEERKAKWDQHYNSLVYYHVVRVLVGHIGARAQSMIDVGSGGYPYLEWFDHIPDRTSLDLRTPYEGPGVKSIKTNFLEYEPDQTFDIASCFQVMEHVPDDVIGPFAQKLLQIGKTVIVSLPYKWQKDWAQTHIQDPVDREKILSWFKREPNYEYICHEVRIDRPRIIQVYERNRDKWSYSGERGRQRVARHEARQDGEPLHIDHFNQPREPMVTGPVEIADRLADGPARSGAVRRRPG